MKLILDVDTGIDDAFALAYALASPEVELLGVTCTYGNVLVDDAVRNTLALLELFGRPDVPVYAGPSPAGWAVAEVSAFIHGTNGLGEVSLPAP
ncbi:nucleoside hydrolase, partial [Corynebacterium sp.]|uniref:nucleoside hydrolase n=1 Tax=Corynebacterium sp. TaxID=1720 RepID=UPI0026E0CBF2